MFYNVASPAGTGMQHSTSHSCTARATVNRTSIGPGSRWRDRTFATTTTLLHWKICCTHVTVVAL